MLNDILAFISLPGGSEWIIILVIALLIFGRRLPEVARGLGKSLNEFKKGVKDAKDEVEDVKKSVKEDDTDEKDKNKD